MREEESEREMWRGKRVRWMRDVEERGQDKTREEREEKRLQE